MNSSGSVSEASVLRRAPVADISTITHGPKVVPSAPTILAPWRTIRRVLFRYSGRISHLDQVQGFYRPCPRPFLVCCNYGHLNDLLIELRVRIVPVGIGIPLASRTTSLEHDDVWSEIWPVRLLNDLC